MGELSVTLTLSAGPWEHLIRDWNAGATPVGRAATVWFAQGSWHWSTGDVYGRTIAWGTAASEADARAAADAALAEWCRKHAPPAVAPLESQEALAEQIIARPRGPSSEEDSIRRALARAVVVETCVRRDAQWEKRLRPLRESVVAYLAAKKEYVETAWPGYFVANMDEKRNALVDAAIALFPEPARDTEPAPPKGPTCDPCSRHQCHNCSESWRTPLGVVLCGCDCRELTEPAPPLKGGEEGT